MPAKKTILITGAARGIGKAIAESLISHNLILITKTDKSFNSMKKEFPDATCYKCDLANEKALNDLIKEIKSSYKHIDVIVNNAGFYVFKTFEETDSEDFDELYKIYMRTPFVLIKGLLPKLKASEEPTVINIASAAAFTRFKSESIYSAVKVGLVAFTEIIREELRADKIKFTNIKPYGVNTWNDPDKDKLLRPEDIGSLVKFIVDCHYNCEILDVSLSSVGQWRGGTPPWAK